jgi:tRNA G18 (ribose-2'-O)-methylase SpoU
MGAVLGVPWTRTGADPLADLQGFTTIAMTLAADSTDLGAIRLGSARRAVLLGTEGNGLVADLAARADLRVRIPMAPGVDSLNVAAASAIALYALQPDS